MLVAVLCKGMLLTRGEKVNAEILEDGDELCMPGRGDHLVAGWLCYGKTKRV